MIQSHYFVERMVQERPQELLRVAREIAASRAARDSRAVYRAASRVAQTRRASLRYDPVAHLLASGLTRVGRVLVSVGRRLETVQERRERASVSPLVASCVMCGEPLGRGSSFPMQSTGM